jgi:dTDP-glucose 4,6-dehydratase
MIEPVADRKGHDRRYSVDTTKVRALGWAPAHDLDSALESTVAWYRDRRDWWEPLRPAGAGALS